MGNEVEGGSGAAADVWSALVGYLTGANTLSWDAMRKTCFFNVKRKC